MPFMNISRSLILSVRALRRRVRISLSIAAPFCIQHICLSHLTVRCLEFEVDSVTNQLNTLLAQLAFQTFPIVTAFGIVKAHQASQVVELTLYYVDKQKSPRHDAAVIFYV